MKNVLSEYNDDLNLQKFRFFENNEYNKNNKFLTTLLSDLHIYEIKIVNSLLYIFNTYMTIHQNNQQILDLFKNIVLKENYFILDYIQFLKICNIQKSNITPKTLENHLENIRSRGVKYLKEETTHRRRIITSFIQKIEVITPKDLFDEKIISNTKIKIKIDKEFYEDIFEFNSNYTQLNILSNKLRSKFSISLYEELQRIVNIRYIDYKNKDKEKRVKNYKDSHFYDLNQLNKMFDTNYKFISLFKQKLEMSLQQLYKQNLLNEEDYKFKFVYTKINLEIIIIRNEEKLNEEEKLKQRKKIKKLLNIEEPSFND